MKPHLVAAQREPYRQRPKLTAENLAADLGAMQSPEGGEVGGGVRAPGGNLNACKKCQHIGLGALGFYHSLSSSLPKASAGALRTTTACTAPPSAPSAVPTTQKADPPSTQMSAVSLIKNT